MTCLSNEGIVTVTYWIPTSRGSETIRVATGVVAGRDISESGCSSSVQERVQEPKRTLTRGGTRVVDECNDAREDRARAARAADEASLLLEHNLDVVALRGDVGERATVAAEAARVGVAERGQVGRHCGVLVGRPGEDRGEASGGEGCRSLRNASRGSNRGQAVQHFS